MELVSYSRFAKRIRTLEIFFDLNCISNGVRLLPLDGSACMEATIGDHEAHARFSALFSRMPSLRNLLIHAPCYQSDTLNDAILPAFLPFHGGLLRPGLRYAIWEGEETDHIHTIDVASYQTLLPKLLHTVRVKLPNLEQFSIFGFANSRWQSSLAGTEGVLEAMTAKPVLRALTTLNLELEMSTDNTCIALTKIGELIGSNPNLRVLKLRAGPGTCFTYRTPNSHWIPLLQVLGSDPPFRLHTLEVDGLIASTTAPTLNSIIEVHSPTLRRIVLENTNFRLSHTTRAFFNALAKSEVQYFAWKRVLIHSHPRSYLRGTHLRHYIVEDQVLTSLWNHGITPVPNSDKDWVLIMWDQDPLDTLSVWDGEDGLVGKDGIKVAFKNVVEAIDCGAI